MWVLHGFVYWIYRCRLGLWSQNPVVPPSSFFVCVECNAMQCNYESDCFQVRLKRPGGSRSGHGIAVKAFINHWCSKSNPISGIPFHKSTQLCFMSAHCMYTYNNMGSITLIVTPTLSNPSLLNKFLEWFTFSLRETGCGSWTEWKIDREFILGHKYVMHLSACALVTIF